MKHVCNAAMPVACTVSHEYPDVRVYQKDDMIYSVEGF